MKKYFSSLQETMCSFLSAQFSFTGIHFKSAMQYWTYIPLKYIIGYKKKYFFLFCGVLYFITIIKLLKHIWPTLRVIQVLGTSPWKAYMWNLMGKYFYLTVTALGTEMFISDSDCISTDLLKEFPYFHFESSNQYSPQFSYSKTDCLDFLSMLSYYIYKGLILVLMYSVTMMISFCVWP